jgi:hypothetical protein
MPEVVQPPVIQTAPVEMPTWMRKMYPAMGPTDVYSLQSPNGKVVWTSNPGPQTWFLLCPFDEILLGGARGGGKSAGLIAWMATGDYTLPVDDPARPSFILDPDFRGLLLREEYQSMADFVEQAIEFYRPFGGKPAGNPTVVTFKSGAKIYFNHLGDEEAYNKYRGWNLTRIGVEELTRIESQKRYLKLLGSLRSTMRVRNGKQFPKLRTQIANTTNPDGPGQEWVKNRFIRVYSGGKIVPWNTPMLDSITGLKRIFVPAQLKDNPYLNEDRKYMGMLLSQDEVTQAQWIYGDWDAGSGLFFREYRPDGPRGQKEVDETPWASHIPENPPQLKPWWYRWLSCDYGYDHPACVHKFCRNEQDKRIHVYDELQVRQVGAYELGVLIAKWCLPELESLPDHQLTLYLSPDAFNKQDATKTRAEQIEMGIKEILGPYGAVLMRYNDDERAAAMSNPKYAAIMFEQRKREADGHMCIAIKPANNDVDGGCSYFRELLRFRPILTETQDELKQRLESIYSRSGMEAYEREVAAAQSHEPEILPKIQIWKTCRELDRCLKAAIHDDPPKNERYRKFNAEDGVGGDDALDCGRYGIMAFKEIRTQIPKRYWVNERIEQAQQQNVAAFGEEITDQTRLMQIAACQSARFDKTNAHVGGSFSLPRASSSRHKVN